VLRNRREVDAVTVVYRMRMRLQPPGDGPVRILRQEGSMLFVPNAHGEWKADLIDVRLRTEGAGA
jgi:hypothetical protein